MQRRTRLFLSVFAAAALAGTLDTTGLPAQTATSEQAPIKAPTRLHSEPQTYLLLPMANQRTRFFYVPGWLDRAANLQARFELIARGLERWMDQEAVEYVVYVLDRDEWGKAGYTVPYGVPIRVGQRGVAAPAGGDAETVALWRDLLGGRLPQVAGTPIRSSPDELASIVVSDQMAQVLAAEALVDATGLAGDKHWVRGLSTHVASLSVVLRAGSDRPSDVSSLYQSFLRFRQPKTMSLDQYDPDVDFKDWLYFQAHFHFAALTLLDKTGKKDGLQKLEKLRKKNGGVLRGDVLRRKFEGLDNYLRENFSAVRLR